MLIHFTAEQMQHLREIQEKYAPQREQLARDIEATSNAEERKRLIIKQQALHDVIQAEIDEYSDKCQRELFQPIKEKGADAIIDNAKEQAPTILELIHSDIKKEYAITLDGIEAAKRLGIGTNKNGVFYVNANYAADWLKEELQLHLEALQGNKEALQLLLEAIIEAVEESPYTDTTEIKDTGAKPLEVKRFRRSPLADIKTYGLMNDKVNAQLIQDSGSIFTQNTDGQMTLTWSVNQAPQKREQVPVYVALTYEGTEGRLTKKLTAFDNAVYNAVATRFYYWQQDNQQKPLYITPQEIWRTMNGKRSGDGKAKPSAAQVKRICTSLDKMRFTRFYMDISEEIKAYELHIEDERIIGGRIDGYLLNSTKVEFTTDKGNTVAGYRIGEEPLLYTYNAAKKHILYVPYEMLDTSTNTSDGENVTEFRNYLLQQIQLMKNAAEDGRKGKYFKRNSIILIETIYHDTGIQTPEERAAATAFTTENARNSYIRKTRKADRGKIEGILEAWKAKGWIKGYTVLNANNKPIKERQQAKGYEIHI